MKIITPVYRFVINESKFGGLHGVEFVRISDLNSVLPEVTIIGPTWEMESGNGFGLCVRNAAHTEHDGSDGQAQQPSDDSVRIREMIGKMQLSGSDMAHVPLTFPSKTGE